MPDLDGAAVPPQCRAVPIFPTEHGASVRVSALVHTPPAGPAALVLLASTWMGRSYLGALTDASGAILGWLELWVQAAGEVPGLDDQEAGTNPELDQRWKRWSAAAGRGTLAVHCGFESVHPPPVWLDVAHGRAVVPQDPGTGQAYALCTDDALLLSAGLEPFSESRRRLLSVPGQPSAGLLAASGEATGAVRPVADALPDGGKALLPFNPEGGFLLVRRLAPMEWGAFAQLLSGHPFRGLQAGRPPVKLAGPYAGLDDWDRLQQGGAHLFAGNRGRAGRFHEAFHLKLLLFSSMLRATRDQVAATQLPQLNLTSTSFRVDLSAAGGNLPALWTARAALVEPPASVALTAPGDLRYFKPASELGSSVYRPEGAGRAVKGRGELRVRKVTRSGERVQVEATLVSQEVARASTRDLVWARLPLPGVGAFDLVGNIDAAEALAQGEARFRTAPLEPSASVLSALQAAEGGVFPGTPFRTLPLLSSPFDLYGLGVLGVELFLTGAGKPLPVVLDAVLSLARAMDSAGTGPWGERARTLAATDPRWNESLGPQHHGHDSGTAQTASALLPLELWWDTVALIARLFPGSSAQAFCRDFGDAPPHQLESVYANPIAAFDVLSLRSQSLLLCDWPTNREIARVIQKVR